MYNRYSSISGVHRPILFFYFSAYITPLESDLQSGENLVFGYWIHLETRRGLSQISVNQRIMHFLYLFVIIAISAAGKMLRCTECRKDSCWSFVLVFTVHVLLNTYRAVNWETKFHTTASCSIGLGSLSSCNIAPVPEAESAEFSGCESDARMCA